MPSILSKLEPLTVWLKYIGPKTVKHDVKMVKHDVKMVKHDENGQTRCNITCS